MMVNNPLMRPYFVGGFTKKFCVDSYLLHKMGEMMIHILIPILKISFIDFWWQQEQFCW